MSWLREFEFGFQDFAEGWISGKIKKLDEDWHLEFLVVESLTSSENYVWYISLLW